jgi:hypothetical protein
VVVVDVEVVLFVVKVLTVLLLEVLVVVEVTVVLVVLQRHQGDALEPVVVVVMSVMEPPPVLPPVEPAVVGVHLQPSSASHVDLVVWPEHSADLKVKFWPHTWPE